MKRSEPWFKCFPADWLEATRGFTPEQRGIYFDCLCLIYQFGRPLPDDDKWMSHQLHVSTRLWRSVRDALVALGKLVKTDDGYTNPRAESELVSRSNQARTNAEIASNRERTKREKSEKTNEINETPARNEHHARAFQISDNRKKKEYSPTDRPEQVAAREGPGERFKPELKSAFNGQTTALVEEISSHLVGDETAAQRWLATTLAETGTKPVLEAFRLLTEKRARGEPVPLVLPWFAKTAATIAARQRSPDDDAEARAERSRRINEDLRRQFSNQGAAA